ncbi:phosphotransferase enzyme family protein [Paucisalibacillus globulus]|uniref:phosphotransferase enzyme family protein n=1 Tax=Paucisalibacillus globulus TaxID=351095 RepID=UPI00042159A7|nr:phosphotransferase [Paucisalibacillus globulus]
MERAVEAVYSQEIINRFLKVYHLEPTYKVLGDFENYVYEVMKEGKPYILRITHSSHRNENEIVGEIEWMNYLYNHGANVSVVFPSNDNNLVEKQVASDQSIFFGSLFSKVKGRPIRANDKEFHAKLFESWGKETGKLHRLTKNYLPEKVTRKNWYEDDLFEIEKYVPEEIMVIERTKEVIQVLKELPQEDFGLIHNDIHNKNFFYDGIEIHIFDFDDACYFWNVSDIAIPLYYSCYSLFSDKTRIEEKRNFAKHFLTAFMKGYTEEKEPPKDWEKLLTLFLEVRDITLYAALNKKIPPKDRNEDLLKSMQQIKERIERKEAIVSIT